MRKAGLIAVAALPLAAQTGQFQKEYLGELEHASKQVNALAQAMPAEKYAWRPGAGVRSVSEVYMHIALGNFMLLDTAGVKAPADLYGTVESGAAGRSAALVRANQKLETTITDKARVTALVKRSLDAARDAFNRATPDALEKHVNFFGRDVTVRAVYLRLLVHLDEHMGQSVAYARMNGVVPPWSK